MTKLSIIRALMTICYIYGFYILVFEKETAVRGFTSKKNRVSTRHSKRKARKIFNNIIFTELLIKFDNLLDAQNFKNKSSKGLFKFYMIVQFVVCMEVLSAQSISSRVVYSLLISLFPVMYLYSNLGRRQRKIGGEVEIFLGELFAQYKMHSDTITALHSCLDRKYDMPYLSSDLYILVRDLREYRTLSELDNVLGRFSYSVGTMWAKKVCYMIKYDILKGSDQSAAIESLIADLGIGKDLQEDIKRKNNETIILVKYMYPVLYLGSIFICVNVLGMTVSSFIVNQLFNQTGQQMFILIVLLELVNVITLHFIGSDRLDVMG